MTKLTKLIIEKISTKEKGRKNTVTNVMAPVEISNTTSCRVRVNCISKNGYVNTFLSDGERRFLKIMSWKRRNDFRS